MRLVTGPACGSRASGRGRWNGRPNINTDECNSEETESESNTVMKEIALK